MRTLMNARLFNNLPLFRLILIVYAMYLVTLLQRAGQYLTSSCGSTKTLKN